MGPFLNFKRHPSIHMTSNNTVRQKRTLHSFKIMLLNICAAH